MGKPKVTEVDEKCIQQHHYGDMHLQRFTINQNTTFYMHTHNWDWMEN